MQDDAEKHQRRFKAILLDLAPLLERVEAAEGWLPSLKAGVAGALKSAGEPDHADRLFRLLLEDNPLQLWCWVGRIEIARDQGRHADAATLGRAAHGHFPSDPLILLKAVEAERMAGDASSALDWLAQVGGVPRDHAALLGKVVQLHREAGTVAQAGDYADRLLAIAPDDGVALIARIEATLQNGDAAAAAAHGRAALTVCPDHAEIRVRAAQALVAAGQADEARTVIATLDPAAGFDAERAAIEQAKPVAPQTGPDRPPEEPAETVADLLAAHAAGRIPVDDVATRLDAVAPDVASADWPAVWQLWRLARSHRVRNVCRACADRFAGDAGLPWYFGVWLIGELVEQGEDDLAGRLSAITLDRLVDDDERVIFALEDALLRNGPRAALATARAQPVAERSPEAAERLGRILLGGGYCDIAHRYAARGCRTWPDSAELRQIGVDAATAMGRADLALSLLPADQPRLAARRFSVLLRSGDFAAANALLRDWPRGVPPPAASERVELHILRGALDEAEAVVAGLDMSADDPDSVLLRRPRATRVGTLLNEARILSRLAGAMDNPDHAQGLFLPARAILADKVDPSAPPDRMPDTPPPVFQFWPASPPAEIRSITEAWAAAAPDDYRLISTAGARDFLKSEFGTDALRAFGNATDREQMADMVHLACLLQSGGLAVGIDQVPRGPVVSLFGADDRAVFFVEPTGAVSADAILAPPDHPAIRLAFDMIVASGLARENDHRWFRTGPGLISRAVASFLSAGGAEAADRISLRPIAQLRRHVLPHRRFERQLRAERRIRTDPGVQALRHALVDPGAPDGAAPPQD